MYRFCMMCSLVPLFEFLQEMSQVLEILSRCLLQIVKCKETPIHQQKASGLLEEGPEEVCHLSPLASCFCLQIVIV